MVLIMGERITGTKAGESGHYVYELKVIGEPTGCEVRTPPHLHLLYLSSLRSPKLLLTKLAWLCVLCGPGPLGCLFMIGFLSVCLRLY